MNGVTRIKLAAITQDTKLRGKALADALARVMNQATLSEEKGQGMKQHAKTSKK